MGRWFSSRALIAVCCILVGLLGALAAMQYRWSARVATADAQREREHLASAALLFAREFNSMAGQATQFLQTEAPAAMRSGERLTGIPKMLSGLYYVDAPSGGVRRVLRLTKEGAFEPAAPPEWSPASKCDATVIDEPPALVVPMYDIATSESRGAGGVHVLKTIHVRTDRCFLAKLDQTYLRGTILPLFIQRSFGETTVSEYDFSVVPKGRPDHPLYGLTVQPDLRQPFFSIPPIPPQFPLAAQAGAPTTTGSVFFMRRSRTAIDKDSPNLYGPGAWVLEVAHKDVPLAEAFERTRRRDLMLSLGVELLLVAAIAFLVIGARRMHWLADQKMRFIAGVSHELRTPVSSIAMLSRNQADGLVTGAEKIKQYGELIHQQSRRLNDMVEQTLQLAGIHSGLRRTARDEVDLSALIREAVATRTAELARAGFAVELDLSLNLTPVLGDAKLLRTAFDNLLDNAVKHAGGGRWIRVTAELAPKENEIQISVEDRGSGIDPADQAEIFEPFCRGRAAVEAQIPGSGLGLSLVRSAAEVHRGTVTVVSEPGRGSTFTMHLPL